MEGLMQDYGLVLMNFSGVYPGQQFWKEKAVFWAEVGDILGTNCYCDGQAIEEIRSSIENFPVKGIHFIDSGNYHYMSRIWMEKIKTPFGLLVFDNHTDMQPPAFGGLLSCGGWIADALTELGNLKEVLLVGPDAEDYAAVEPKLQEKVRFFGKEKLADKNRQSFLSYLQKADQKIPWYISIDKDVLCKKDAHTTWSQGDMTLEELLDCLQTAVRELQNNQGEILGVDICGENDEKNCGSSQVNDQANGKLLEFLEHVLK